MLSKETYQTILDGFDGIAYLADIETYKLLYINKKLASYLNINGPDGYADKKCYEVLQEKNAPCPFCTNALLSPDNPQNWERYHPKLQRFFELKDSVVEIDGKKLRLEFGIDITHIKNYVDTVEKNYSREQTLTNCAKMLCMEENLDFAVSTILEQVVLFFGADRSYVFEYNPQLYEMSATHVYVRPQAKPFRNVLSAVGQKELQKWLSQFCDENQVYLQTVETDFAPFPELHSAFAKRGIKNLLICPVYSKGRFLGILGVDNARGNLDGKELICTVALFIADNLRKRRTIEKLNYLSETDELTGVYNRNKFNAVVYEIRQKQGHFGIIYADVNGLKKTNDTYGHQKGDELLQNAGAFLKKFFGNRIYRVGGDEFVIIMQDIPKEEFDAVLARFAECLAKEQNISLSVGECYCTEQFIDEALQKADEIMFERKRQYYARQIR